MGFIFYLSHDSGKASMKKSFTIVNTLVSSIPASDNPGKDKIQASQQKKYLNQLNIMVRKSAHIAEFFLLSVLAANVLFAFGYKGRGTIIYILFFCLLYAVFDEYHQLLVDTRTSSVSDVLIDFSGSILGMLFYYTFYYKIYNTLLKKRC